MKSKYSHKNYLLKAVKLIPPIEQSTGSVGKLIMLSNHIGNIEDIPHRSLQEIRLADLLVFEEDRPARQVLKIAKVHREYLKFSEHIQKETLEVVEEHLKSGKTVTYMSDQGCPALADPGCALVNLALTVGAKLKVVPGPSAITAAIAACPFPLKRYHFEGFLPQKKGDMAARLRKLKNHPEPIVLLDAPYRRYNLLKAIEDTMPNRRIFLAIDISGAGEDFQLGVSSELLRRGDCREKLNFVLILEEFGSARSRG